MTAPTCLLDGGHDADPGVTVEWDDRMVPACKRCVAKLEAVNTHPVAECPQDARPIAREQLIEIVTKHEPASTRHIADAFDVGTMTSDRIGWCRMERALAAAVRAGALDVERVDPTKKKSPLRYRVRRAA